ncbi:hypothetical protein BDW22DRAFT_1429783 [Trametopsis cervina]|nr:hypothetical protein BDW22DRAFT_1429783 [Trametopsis cervina]
MSYANTRPANTYPPQQPYADNDNYYSYDNNTQPHQSYEQAGYNYSEPGFPAYKDEPGFNGASKERETVVPAASADDFSSSTRALGPRSAKSLKRWRHEHQGNLWTAGGGVRCCGRFFCCTIMLFVFFLVGIVMSLLLWVKPPNIVIGDIQLSNATNAINFQDDGVAVTLDVPISVNNPNYFSVNFQNIHADVVYPINNTKIGAGDLWNLKIGSNQQTNFSVPFMLNYTTSIDPNFAILGDIANHCGFGSSSGSSAITVNYAITLDFKIGVIPIKPTIRNSASFACPFSLTDIEGLLKQAGLNIPGIGTLLKALF